MRPLYAIAPLALLLALFGPPPHEANKVLAEFMDQVLGHKAAQPLDSGGERVRTKPDLTGNVVETSFSR